MLLLCQVPVQPARGVQPDGDEHVGRHLHVLHLHLLPGVCRHELSSQVRGGGGAYSTLSRYNMKCSGENEILREILHVVSRFPLHFMLFRGNFDSFSNSEQQCSQNDIDIHCKKSFGGF